jgi:hypothetical protein
MNWKDLDKRWQKCGDTPPGQVFEGCITYSVEYLPVPGGEPLAVRVCKSSAHPLKSYSDARQNEKTSIVLHLTAGYGGFSMCGQNGPVAAHFLIGREGNVYQIVPTELWANHATWWNPNSIGIEIDNIGPLHKDGSKLRSAYKDPYCEEGDAGVFVEKDFR